MKKLLALVLVACMILAVGAFSAFADEGDLVGLSMPTKSLERWNRDGTYLKEQFEAAGYKVELTYSDNDAVKQNNDIANMIADGVKVLVVVAIDADSLSATLADAKEAGITVIAYDRLINIFLIDSAVEVGRDIRSEIADVAFADVEGDEGDVFVIGNGFLDGLAKCITGHHDDAVAVVDGLLDGGGTVFIGVGSRLVILEGEAVHHPWRLRHH